MRDAEFEWDDRKARANLKKHGVVFWDARKVFDDPAVFDYDDDSMDYGEDRYLAIGFVDGRFVTVTYTMRGDRIRIISARKAEPYEEFRYFSRI